VLVTHGPARGHLDFMNGSSHGCPHLLREIWRVRPRVHVFGHIHAARGLEVAEWGWLRWVYDGVCCGEGGIAVVEGMIVVWVWMWVFHFCG
jgi:hypothetical protein